MTDFCLLADRLPFAAPPLKQTAHLFIKPEFTHRPSVANFCGVSKRQIAAPISHDAAFMDKSMNQVLAESLVRLMAERGLNYTSLAKLAKVAPNTIKHYCRNSGEDFTPAKGKERSATLSIVERLADALGVDPLALLTDEEELQRRVMAIANVLVRRSKSSIEP